jgi:predicted DsbA family dithiol-disulfide isomerase
VTTAPPAPAIQITVFSDVLCVWAHIAQIRIDEAQREFGAAIAVSSRCCSVFGDTANKLGVGWADRGGYAGFNRHLREIGERFEHITIHPELWLDVRPASSLGVHLTIKALQHVDGARANGFVRGLRVAFFCECRDIAQWLVQRDVLAAVGADIVQVERCLHSGVAHAALASDLAAADARRIQGSPTIVLNEGRQILYGDVGYRVLEANLREILRAPSAENASWC